MTYNKPFGVSYTDMAIYYDEHIKKADRNDTLLYQYLYHLIYMLANKARYFHKFEDYDYFALYAATKIYMRSINQVTQSDKPIKSILNYIKAVIYPLKVDYQKEMYDEVINPNTDDRIDGEKLKSNLQAPVQADYMRGLAEEVCFQINRLPKYINESVMDTPYKNDELVCKRLYMSVLLSLLNSVTISNAGLEKLKRHEGTDTHFDNTTFKLLDKEKVSSTVIWRLDESMRDYVEVLTNKVKKKFGRDLLELKQSFLLPEEDLDAIMMSAYNTDARDNNEET